MKLTVNTKSFAGIAALLTVLALFTASCKKPTYFKLTDEDMAWLSVDNNQTLTFTNGMGMEQEFSVARRQRYYLQDGDTYNEQTAALFIQVDDSSNYAEDTRGGLVITKVEGGLYVSFSWPHFPINDYPLHTATQQIAVIGGINYLDVIEIDGSLLTDVRRYVKKIWYSKSQGVLQYEDTFGNTWTRSI